MYIFSYLAGALQKGFSMKKPPFIILCVLIMNMLSGQGHPDVLWQLENLFASYFWIQIVEIPDETQEADSTVQLASKAIRVKKKPMVIYSPGNLNLGLKHTLQQIVREQTCN